jgi:hypothetical protein
VRGFLLAIAVLSLPAFAGGQSALPAEIRLFGAFFDDAGTHDSALVAALGGYVAPIEVWETFKREWDEFLGRRQLDFYHATDCQGKEGHRQFEGWSSEERDVTHREAVEIITRHPIVPIGLGCRHCHF